MCYRHCASSQNTDKSDQKTIQQGQSQGFHNTVIHILLLAVSGCSEIYARGYCKYFFISQIVLTCAVWALLTNCTKAFEFLFPDNHLTVMCRPIWKMKYFLALHSGSFFPKSAFYSVTCAWLVIQTQFLHDRSDVSSTACIAISSQGKLPIRR